MKQLKFENEPNVVANRWKGHVVQQHPSYCIVIDQNVVMDLQLF